MPHSQLATGDTSPVSVALRVRSVGLCPGQRFRGRLGVPSRRVDVERAMAPPSAMHPQPSRARSRKTP